MGVVKVKSKKKEAVKSQASAYFDAGKFVEKCITTQSRKQTED